MCGNPNPRLVAALDQQVATVRQRVDQLVAEFVDQLDDDNGDITRSAATLAPMFLAHAVRAPGAITDVAVVALLLLAEARRKSRS